MSSQLSYRGALVALALLWLQPTAQAAGEAAARGPVLHYQLYAGGLRVVELDLSLAVAEDRYAIEIAAAATGALDWFVDWRTRNRTEGTVGPAGLRPVTHSVVSDGGEETRRILLEYDTRGGFSRKVLEPPVEDEPREPVPAEMTENTVDVLTAIASLLHGVGEGRDCDATVPVFDGRRRFNVEFVDRGPDTLDSSRYSIFEGEARLCTAAVELVKGRWKRRQRWLEEESDQDSGLVQIWLGEVSEAPTPVPVRMVIRSPYGVGIAHLTGVTQARAVPAPPQEAALP